jgi:hypothetical protein
VVERGTKLTNDRVTGRLTDESGVPASAVESRSLQSAFGGVPMSTLLKYRRAGDQMDRFGM